MITFIVQNETHALNFAPIIRRLLEMNIPEEYLCTIHLDHIFGLSTRNIITVPNQKTLAIPISSPYYHLKGFERLRWLLVNRHLLVQSVSDTTLLIIGSDGAIQRLMANAVRAKGGKVIMLYDGLLHPWPSTLRGRFAYDVKRRINRSAAALNLNHLVPSDIGHSRLDLIYVMNTTVKEILLDQKVSTPIQVISLPRFDAYITQFEQLCTRDGAVRKHCLYATGSYKWHSQFKEHAQQLRDLDDLQHFAAHHPDWQIRIRIHPREVKAEYTDRSWPNNIELSDSNRWVVEDLAWASVLITARSTVAVEAEIVGVPVMIYTRNFGCPRPNSYFARSTYFFQSDDLGQLQGLIHQTASPKEVVSSVNRIAETFAEYLS